MGEAGGGTGTRHEARASGYLPPGRCDNPMLPSLSPPCRHRVPADIILRALRLQRPVNSFSRKGGMENHTACPPAKKLLHERHSRAAKHAGSCRSISASRSLALVCNGGERRGGRPSQVSRLPPCPVRATDGRALTSCRTVRALAFDGGIKNAGRMSARFSFPT